SPHQRSTGARGPVFRSEYYSWARLSSDNALALADWNAALGVGPFVLGAADANSRRFGRCSVDRTNQFGRKPRWVYWPVPDRDGAYWESQLHRRRHIPLGGIFPGGGINVHAQISELVIG